MKKILPLFSLICLFSGVVCGAAPVYIDDFDAFIDFIQNGDNDSDYCGYVPRNGGLVGKCDKAGTICTDAHPDKPKQVIKFKALCFDVSTTKAPGYTCAAVCCEEGWYVWYSTKNGTCPGDKAQLQGRCHTEKYVKDFCDSKCGNCPEGESCQPDIFTNSYGCLAYRDCKCQPNPQLDQQPSERCPDGTTGTWPNCVCKDKSKRWDKDRKECVPKCPDPDMVYNEQTDKCECKDENKILENGKCVEGEECHWEAKLYVNCKNNSKHPCDKQFFEIQKFPIDKKFKEELNIQSCNDLKAKFENKNGMYIPVAQQSGQNTIELLALENKICELACPEKPTSNQVSVTIYNQQDTRPTETWPFKADIDSAKSVLDAAFSGEGSVWKDKEGKFNKARLASDLTAGVVLGTVGGVVSGVVIKKKQIEKGFEALHCTVGGQKVADWGDEFMVGFRR